MSPSRSWATKTVGRPAERVERGQGGGVAAADRSRPRRSSGSAPRALADRRRASCCRARRCRSPRGSCAVGRQLAQRRPEPDLALLLAAERRAAQRHQHAAGSTPAHWVIRYAAVAPAARLSTPTYASRAAERHVGDERDDGDARRPPGRRPPPPPAGWSGALRITPSEPRRPIAASVGRRARRVALLARGGSGRGTTAGRSAGQLGLQRGPDALSEPVRRLHDQVDQEGPARQAAPARAGGRARRSPARPGRPSPARTPGRPCSTRSTVARLRPGLRGDVGHVRCVPPLPAHPATRFAMRRS